MIAESPRWREEERGIETQEKHLHIWSITKAIVILDLYSTSMKFEPLKTMW